MITSPHKREQSLDSNLFLYLVLETLRIDYPLWPVILPHEPCVTIYNTCKLCFTCAM